MLDILKFKPGENERKKLLNHEVLPPLKESLIQSEMHKLMAELTLLSNK